jgi:hypothetical protein
MHSLKSVRDRVCYLNNKLDPTYVNDVAKQAYEELWRSKPWSWRRRYGQITSVADYSTGNIATLTQGLSAVAGSGTTWTAAFVRRHLRPSNTSTAGDIRDYLIDARTSDTAITIADPYEGATISSDTAYTIYQRWYTLPVDFDSLEVLKETSGPSIVGLVSRAEFETLEPDANSTGNAYWLIDAGVATFDLYSTGTVGMTEGSATAAGTTTTWLSARDKNQRFRIPSYPEAGDFRVATVTDGTTIVLDRAWPLPTKTGLSYVISPAGERMVEIFPRPSANTAIQMFYFATLPPLSRDTEVPSYLPANYHEVWLKWTEFLCGVGSYELLDKAVMDLTARDGLSRRGIIRSRPFGGNERQKSLLPTQYPGFWPGGR